MDNREAVEQLRSIFNLCDEDGDGKISILELLQRKEMLSYGKQMSLLVKSLDPAGQGVITFEQFCDGIKTFLITRSTRKGDSFDSVTSDSSDINLVSSTQTFSEEDSDSAFSGEEIHPAGLSRPAIYKLTTSDEDVCSDESDVGLNRAKVSGTDKHSNPIHSLSVGSLAISHFKRDSPKAKFRHHSFNPLYSSDNGDITEEDYFELSSQVDKLEKKVKSLEFEKTNSLTRQGNLQQTNSSLKDRLDLVLDQLKEKERKLEKQKRDSEQKRNETIKKIQAETEFELLQLRHRLEEYTLQNEKLHNSESELKMRLQEEKESFVSVKEALSDSEKELAIYQKKLSKSQEIYRREKEKWLTERDELRRLLHDLAQQNSILKADMDNALTHRRSTASIDLDFTKEIELLNKENDQLKEENARLMADLLQQGRSLVASDRSSLAAELEAKSRDELMVRLSEESEHCQRLQAYIESLLINVMNKHPELLEVKTSK